MCLQSLSWHMFLFLVCKVLVLVLSWNLDLGNMVFITLLFLQRVSIACYAERCISNSKSVRPSVRHTLALCQNDSSYDHGVFTGG